jgi:hypothetical protein
LDGKNTQFKCNILQKNVNYNKNRNIVLEDFFISSFLCGNSSNVVEKGVKGITVVDVPHDNKRKGLQKRLRRGTKSKMIAKN